MSIDNEKDIGKDLLKQGEDKEEEKEETYAEFVEREKRQLLEKINQITGGKVLIKFVSSKEFDRAKSNFSEYEIGDEEAKQQAELTPEQYGRVLEAINAMQSKLKMKKEKGKKRKKSVLEELFKL